MESEYRTISINPRRRKRFLEFLALESVAHRKKKKLQYRKNFLSKIDKLRAVEKVAQLRKEDKLEPASRKMDEIERKVYLIAQKEDELETIEQNTKDIVSKEMDDISDIKTRVLSIQQALNKIKKEKKSNKKKKK